MFIHVFTVNSMWLNVYSTHRTDQTSAFNKNERTTFVPNVEALKFIDLNKKNAH